MSQLSVLARAHRHVREPVDLGDAESLAVEPPDRDASALRAEIDGGERRHQPPASSFRTARRRSRGRSGGGSRGPGIDDDDVDSRRAPRLDLGRRGARVGDDSRELLDRNEREQRASVPLRAVEDAVHLLAGVGHLLLDPHLVRVQVHQPARRG